MNDFVKEFIKEFATVSGDILYAATTDRQYWLYVADPENPLCALAEEQWPVHEYAKIFIKAWERFIKKEDPPRLLGRELTVDGLVAATLHFDSTSAYAPAEARRLTSLFSDQPERITDLIGKKNYDKIHNKLKRTQ